MTLSRETLAARVHAAIAGSGRSQRDIAEAIGLDPSALSKAIAGKRDFKSLEIALLAEELGLRTDDLLAAETARARQQVNIAARIQPGTTRAVSESLRFAEDLLDLDRLLTELGHPPQSSAVSWPTANPTVAPTVQGAVLAGALRRRLKLDRRDLPYDLDDLAALLERSLGIDIAFQPQPEGVDGLAIRSDGFSLVMVSSAAFATRQRFTLAHEICHLLTGDGSQITVDENILGGDSDHERRANAFAATFLIPDHALRTTVPNGSLSDAQLAELLGRFGVSRDALAIRLHELHLINDRERERIRTASSPRLTSRPGRTADLQARDRVRVPGNLLERAMTAYAAGGLGIRPLARLLGKDPDRLLDELTAASSTTDSETAYSL